MRKTLATLVMLALLIVALPFVANAQCRRRTVRRYYSTRSYNSPVRYYAQRQRPSFYRRHRNLINVGIATGAGALIGGVAGGRRGALIGTASGAGLGALYTYVLKAKKRRY
ncbi:MAG: hypothetical protein ABI954_11015 [Pyrinomonadaceae bacterium]